MTSIGFFAVACVLLCVAVNAAGCAASSGAAATGTLVVLNKSEASASLLDRATGEEFARLSTGEGPHEVAVSPDGRTAVVCDYGVRGAPGSTLTIIDLPSQAVTKTIDLKKYHRPHGILYLDERRITVTCEQERVLLIVDVVAGSVVDAIDTDQDISHMVAVTPAGRRAFVTNIGSGSVSVIDLQERTLLSVIPTGGGAEGADVSPDGREVWVGNRAGDTVTVIDAESLEVLATLPCPDFPIRVKFTPDGRHVLVSNARSGDVAVFDAAARIEVHRLSMELQSVEKTDDRLFGDSFGQSPVPVGILVTPDGREAYVANTNADMITMIDLETWTIGRRLTAGREPDGIAYSPLELADGVAGRE